MSSIHAHPPIPNIIGVVRHYIDTMVSNISGMKVFLLDKETTGILSMVYTQSQILQKEVFLFEKIDQQNREKMGHLKAVVFLRPTEENIHLLADELRSPKYGEYHLFFTNTIRNIFIDDLAKADENEVVKKVHEYYADYYAVNNDLFTLNIEGLTFPERFDRIKDGVIAALLSLKKKPSIRYQEKSQQAKNLAQEVSRAINGEVELFKFRELEVPPLLLILDRKDDPITPLLMQWTYQAMVHELLKISNNRVDLSKAPGIHPDLKEVVLSPEGDQFYQANLESNYGDLCANVKTLMEEYQAKSNKNKNISSLEDMREFVDQFPEFRKMSGNVSKHVAIITEMSRLMDDRNLMAVSELEQELACSHSPSDAANKVSNAMADPSLTVFDKLKLVLLYGIRYEEGGRAREMMQALIQHGGRGGEAIDPTQQSLLQGILDYGGSFQRTGDLLGNKNFFKHAIKKIGGLQGVSNIYAQHKPLLAEILTEISKNKLNINTHPYLVGGPSPSRPQDVIVFVMGGVTYAEELSVSDFNKNSGNINPTGVRVILGGTSIINSHQFLNELAKRRV